MLRPVEQMLLLLLLLLLQQQVLPLTTERLVLFVCVENACRSLMAEAMFNANPPPGWNAESAGTDPAPTVNPRTRPMLEEIGLSLPAHPPRALDPTLIDRANVRITMGCLDDASCPARLRHLELRDWALEDPARLTDAEFRQVRDRLRSRVESLKTELAAQDPGGRATASAPSA